MVTLGIVLYYIVYRIAMYTSFSADVLAILIFVVAGQVICEYMMRLGPAGTLLDLVC